MWLAPIIAAIGTGISAVASAASTLSPLLSVAGTVAGIATSGGKKGGGGGATIQQAAPAAEAVGEDLEAKRRRAAAAIKQKGWGNGSTLLTGGSAYAPASYVGGALRSTFGGA